jgi:hypothetical protein
VEKELAMICEVFAIQHCDDNIDPTDLFLSKEFQDVMNQLKEKIAGC